MCSKEQGFYQSERQERRPMNTPGGDRPKVTNREKETQAMTDDTLRGECKSL